MINKNWLLVGVDSDPRIAGFRLALQQAGFSTPRVMAYHDLAANADLPWNAQTVLRFESPAWCLATVRRLLCAGQTGAEQAGFAAYSAEQIASIALEQGELFAPQQFYYGFAQQLQHWQTALARQPVYASLHHIPDVLLFYDKQRCHALLQQAAIPVPRTFEISDYADLREQMQALRLPRVFVKSRFGSGGSGVIALATNKHGRVQAYTSLVQRGTRLFNGGQVSGLTQEADIALLVNQLCAWGVHVEQWIPKASVQGMSADMRVLMIAGEVAFTVLRKSRSPITNLHLFNQRAEVVELVKKMPADAWAALLATCQRVAALFPQSYYLGLDVAVDVTLRRHVVLEVNAFGDYLKDVSANGLTPYQWLIRHFVC